MNNRIRELRKARGLTLKQLGVIIGAAESTVSQYENEKRQLDKETLIKLSNFFGETIGYILGIEEKGTPVVPEYDEGEKALIDLYRRLPEHQKDLVLQMIMAALGLSE